MPPKAGHQYIDEDEYEEDEELEEIDEDDEEGRDEDEEDEDGKIDDVDEEDEGEEEGEGGRGKQAGAKGQTREDPGDQEDEEEEEPEEELEVAQPWTTLASLPEREDLLRILQELRQDYGKKQLTVLLLGKTGVGKSSLVNSLLNEQAVRVSPFKLQPETESTTRVVRVVTNTDPDVDGFKLRLIDTCGLEDPEAGDTVNYAALQKMCVELRGLAIDAVLYLDRLDLYRVEPMDRRILQCISEQFGKRIWRKTILVLTHGNLTTPPPGMDYDTFVSRRKKLLRKAVGGGFLFRPSLQAVCVENSAGCPTDTEQRRVLPDGTAWMVELAEVLADMALRRPYVYKPSLTRRPDKQFRWLIPLLAVGQAWLWVRFLSPYIDSGFADSKNFVEESWKRRERQRLKLGLHKPLRPATQQLKDQLEKLYQG